MDTAERLGRVETRVDAVEKRIIGHDQQMEHFVSKVGDAQTTARLVLERIEDLAAMRDIVTTIQTTQASQGTLTKILAGIMGAVGIAVLGVLATLLSR